MILGRRGCRRGRHLLRRREGRRQLCRPGRDLVLRLAAVTCALAIMCYAEFASAIPVAGSAYTYHLRDLGRAAGVDHRLGPDPGIVHGCGGHRQVLGDLPQQCFPALRRRRPHHRQLSSGLELTWGPLLIVAIFTTLLVLGTKLSARVNNVFTIIKVAIVLFVIVVGFTYVRAENYTPFVPDPVPTAGTGARRPGPSRCSPSSAVPSLSSTA